MSNDNDKCTCNTTLGLYGEDTASITSCSCKNCSGLANNNHYDHLDHEQLMDEMQNLPTAVREFLLEAVRMIRLLGEHNIDPESHPDLRKYVVDGMESINRALEVHNLSEAAHPGIFKIISELQDIITDAGGLARPTILEEIAKHNEDPLSHPPILERIADLENDPLANPAAFEAHNADVNAHPGLMDAHNASTDAHPELLRDHNSDPNAHLTLLLNHSIDSNSHKEQWDAHNASPDAHHGLIAAHNEDIESHPELRQAMDSVDNRLQESIDTLNAWRIDKIGIVEYGGVPRYRLITTEFDENGGGSSCPYASFSEGDDGWTFTCTFTEDIPISATGSTEEECNENAISTACSLMCPSSTTTYPETTSYIAPDGREFHINRYQDFKTKVTSGSIQILLTYDPNRPMAWSWVSTPGGKIKAPNAEGVIVLRGSTSSDSDGRVTSFGVPTATSSEYGVVKLGIPDGETLFDGPRPVGVSLGKIADVPFRIYMGEYSDKIYDEDGNEIDDDGNIITPTPDPDLPVDPEIVP